MTQKLPILPYATRYGTFLGIYWTLKFFFLPISVEIPVFQLFFVLATLFSPFLTLMYAYKYKHLCESKQISYTQAFSVIFMLHFFAALFVSMSHFIYFRFIDQGLLANHFMQEIQTLYNNPRYTDKLILDDFKKLITDFDALTPIQKTTQFLLSNMYTGFLASSILAFVTKYINFKRKVN